MAVFWLCVKCKLEYLQSVLAQQFFKTYKNYPLCLDVLRFEQNLKSFREDNVICDVFVIERSRLKSLLKLYTFIY